MKTSDMTKMTYRDAIRLGITEEMRLDRDVIFLGEDIGVYGGAFGVSKGCWKSLVRNGFWIPQSPKGPLSGPRWARQPRACVRFVK